MIKERKKEGKNERDKEGEKERKNVKECFTSITSRTAATVSELNKALTEGADLAQSSIPSQGHFVKERNRVP